MIWYRSEKHDECCRNNRWKKHHNDILNRIKSAKEQADNIVLEVPTYISKEVIDSTVIGYLNQSLKERIIIVKQGKDAYIYNTKKRG